MSNFSGIQKSSKPFRPQQRGSAQAVFEKANNPILETDATPRTDGAGERELNLSGAVDHPNNDGGAKYLAGRIAREYRRIVAAGAGIEGEDLSREQRVALRDQLVAAVIDGGNQEPNDAASARSAQAYVVQVASLLFGLIDELPGTPTFLTRSEGGFVHKMEGGVDGVECPHCHTVNPISKSAVGRPSATGMVTFTCERCAKYWEANPSLMLRKAEPTLADVKKELAKQVAILTERLRGLIARGAGVEITERSGSGRFVTKAASGNDPKGLLKTALENGVGVPFSGADPRSEAERASGSGRKFQTRA